MPKIHALHPNTAFFGLPREGGTFVEDVKRWGRMIRGELGPDLMNAKANGTADDFMKLWRQGLEGVPLAVDIETGAANSDEPWTGLDPTRARLKTIAIGTTKWGVSVCWADAPAKVRTIIQGILMEPSIVKVLHNGPWFDLRVLRRYNLPVVTWEDTRDMRRALSSTSKLSLRYLGSLYCDISNWKDEEKAGDDTSADEKFWESDDLDRLQEYNAKDTIVTARVWEAMRRDGPGDERVNTLYQTHKKLSLIAANMHTRGVYVNKPWRNFMGHCVTQSIEEKKEALRTLVGQEDFPCTDHSIRALIYKRHEKDGIKCFGLPDPYDKKMYTNEFLETISVDEPSLLQLIVGGACPPELMPIIEAYWNLQGEKKRLGYIQSDLIDKAIGPDGCLRPGWNSCGTDTGRFSCFVGSTLVVTQAGEKRIDTVQPGDLVWTHTNSWRAVTQVFRQGVKSVRSYKFNHGAIVTCTSDHKFLCSDGQWRPIQEIENERFEIMGSSSRKPASGVGFVQGRESDSDRRANSQTFEHWSAQCGRGASKMFAPGGEKSTGGSPLFPIQERPQQPTLRETWSRDGELEGGLRRWSRLLDSDLVRQTALCTPHCDDETSGVIGVTRRDGGPSYRQQSQEQCIEQLGAGYPLGAQSDSLPASQRQHGCFVKESHDAGSAEVFDIEVADDHSFEVAGVWAHNCSQPNIMNIEQTLRHMLAPKPGYAIVHADKRQLEIRVMQAVAADMMLLDAINSGDLYSAEARTYFNIPPEEKVKKGARQSAKIIRLGRQYGAGVKTCYAQALRMDRTFTLSRTQLLVAAFDKRYYRTVQYWHEEMERVLACGYSESRLMGRRRTYPRPPELSETVNYPIQATAADMMNLELIALDERLRADCPSAHIIIQLHDAIDVECPEKDVPLVERIIDEVMDREWAICGVTRMFGIERKTTYASQEGTWADV